MERLNCATVGQVYASTMKDEIKAPLRILASHRYYWPDTPPYASMLRCIADRWAEDGHEVEIFSTQPSYKPNANIQSRDRVERINGVRINRINLTLEYPHKKIRRLFNIIRFVLSTLAFILRRPRFDVIMASTAPPVLVGFAARIGAKLTGAKFIYHCMDLHPEIGKLSGEFKNKIIYKILLRLDAKNCASSDMVVVLSGDMKKTVLQRPRCKDARVQIINNFALPEFENKLDFPKELMKEKHTFRFLFAGNLGHFQGLEFLIDAMKSLAERDIELVFVGEGRAKHFLQQRSGELTGKAIKFFPHQQVSIARQLMSDADVCVVSLMPHVIQFAYPSKLMTYLEAKKPIFAAIEKKSEMGSFISENQIGLCVDQEDVENIASGIRNMANQKTYNVFLDNVSKVSKSPFQTKKVLNTWSKLIPEVVGG